MLAAPWVARGQQAATRAQIKINTERAISDIDPKIYGNFLEHLGRCIEGGVFDEGSPLSDTNGFRRDVLDAAKKLGFKMGAHFEWHRIVIMPTRRVLMDLWEKNLGYLRAKLLQNASLTYFGVAV